MPYDVSTPSPEDTQARRRGPLRPKVLVTARARVGGEALARMVQLCDLAALAGVLGAEWLRRGPSAALLLEVAASILVMAILVAFEAYKFNVRERLPSHLYRVIGAVGGSALIALTLSVGLRQADTAAISMHLAWCWAAAALLSASHLIWFLYVRSLRRRGLLTPNLVVVGATPTAERLIAAALSSQEANILGIFDDRAARRPRHVLGVPVLGRTADVKTHRLLPYVDRIVVAVPAGASGRIAQLIKELSPVPNAVSLLMDDGDHHRELAARDGILDLPLAHLSGARRRVAQAILKRALDLAVSVTGLVVLLPVFGAIALAIRLDSPGPVFFKQRRHGYLNEEVLVWKFRSMRVEASDFAARRQVSANDERVTRVGRFIRKTSLDELPQLWNVVRGEMSLVGPRPHAIGMLTGGEEASQLVETYAHRHRMKPGLTGWAAVNGSRGPLDTAEAVRRRVSLDLEYVERQSIWLDIAIILRTLPCVLGDSATVR
jgi:Undecaprenyl-phosphate glucose phosphotransferase